MAKTYQQLLDEARRAVREMSVDEVQLALASDDAPVLLDVREKEEFREGHLPDALSIPRGFLEMQVTWFMPGARRPVGGSCSRGRDSTTR